MADTGGIRTARHEKADGRSFGCAEKLQLECFQGVNDKLMLLKAESERRAISLYITAFLSNDINDLDCLSAVGLPPGVANAWPEVMIVAKLVLKDRGGDGSVREFCFQNGFSGWVLKNGKN